MVKYIPFDFSQLRQKFKHERNLNLPKNDKYKFYTSKSKNFDLRYFGVFSILIIYFSTILYYKDTNQCVGSMTESRGK